MISIVIKLKSITNHIFQISISIRNILFVIYCWQIAIDVKFCFDIYILSYGIFKMVGTFTIDFVSSCISVHTIQTAIIYFFILNFKFKQAVIVTSLLNCDALFSEFFYCRHCFWHTAITSILTVIYCKFWKFKSLHFKLRFIFVIMMQD